MNTKTLTLNFFTVTVSILLAAVSRLLPHPPNFAPMLAIGIFGGALFAKKIWAFIIPIASIWISDLLINNIVYAAYFDHFVWFYDGFYWQYAVYAIVPLLSALLFGKTIKVSRIALMGIGAGILFFLVSNFGVWAGTNMYPHTSNGLLTCYIMGLPFLKGTILSNLFYSGILFGAYYVVERTTILSAPGAGYTWKWI
ncbi:DUF6580 family putative transport protein [Chitinophaga sp. Cy-1792]|uniref:DUF6580 family putative transport protein n=1 Tax=Chitinophaga sp. Cy-1792 TaxID=2608339 RepID=UPI001421A068|nr:DUF6580 family putative transport protein [Chitinophaga sp. Cy-1792]NIG55711.1 hypothetical protein [Chitinophaga sp. Cy-1792]